MLSEIIKKTTGGRYGYAPGSDRYYDTENGRFVSHTELKRFSERYAVNQAARWGRTLTRFN